MTTTTTFAVEHLATHGSDATAIVDGERTVTFRDLDRAANRVANGLLADGLVNGDRIAYLGRNCLEAVELLLGAARVGVVVTMLNWRLHPVEIGGVLADSGAGWVVASAEFADVIDLVPGSSLQVRIVGGDHDGWQGWIDAQCADAPNRRLGAHDVALHLYTSGTTGIPKGAMITNAGLAATIPDICELWELDETSVMLLVLPTFHIAGVATILASLWCGARLVLSNDASPSGIASSIEAHHVTNVVLVPALLPALVDVARGHRADLASLRTISYGASPITEQVLRDVIGTLGCRLLQIYGLTETTGCLTALLPEDHNLRINDASMLERLRSCGRARPNVELRIVDPSSEQPCNPGEIGEVQARTARLMRGYWNAPAATTNVLIEGGWFRTGDLGEVDADGFLFLRDRLTDMIVSGGENIYPVEVENALHRHPAVGEVAVIGVPDDRWGEVPKALVVLRPEATATEVELIDHTRSLLARFKCPASIDFVDTLPRNPTGKVLRRQLRDPFWSGRTRPHR